MKNIPASFFFWGSLIALAAILSILFGLRTNKKGKKAVGRTLVVSGILAFLYDIAFLILGTIISIGW